MTVKEIDFADAIKAAGEQYDMEIIEIWSAYSEPRYQLIDEYGGISYQFSSVAEVLKYAGKIPAERCRVFTLEDRGYTVTLQQFVEARQ